MHERTRELEVSLPTHDSKPLIPIVMQHSCQPGTGTELAISKNHATLCVECYAMRSHAGEPFGSLCSQTMVGEHA